MTAAKLVSWRRRGAGLSPARECASVTDELLADLADSVEAANQPLTRSKEPLRRPAVPYTLRRTREDQVTGQEGADQRDDRFSVEWSRVEPTPGTFDPTALDHYESMVDHCLDRGLAPVVTYNHFTSPHWFAACGGWLDRDAPDVFSRYVEQVVTRYGDRIAARSRSTSRTCRDCVLRAR